jgi:hypothetical protein
MGHPKNRRPNLGLPADDCFQEADFGGWATGGKRVVVRKGTDIASGEGHHAIWKFDDITEDSWLLGVPRLYLYFWL